MEGIVVLHNIYSPRVGMKVVFEGRVHEISELSRPDPERCLLIPDVPTLLPVTELRQVMMEREEPTDTEGIALKVLTPVHPDDVEQALNHLGKKLQFMTAKDYGTKDKNTKWAILMNKPRTWTDVFEHFKRDGVLGGSLESFLEIYYEVPKPKP